MEDGTTRCGACGNEMLEHPSGVCSECRRTGPEMLGQQRPPRPCARCGHHQLIRSVVVDRWSLRSSSHVLPLSVTRPQADGTEPSAGILQIYVCRACGFTEWYAADPRAIPIGPAHGTELVTCTPAAGGPFR